MARVILALALLGKASAVTPANAGYTYVSDVTAHTQIDLDMQAIDTATGSADWTTATTLYTTGGNSAKGTGFRTLQGFSKTLTGETEWQSGATYWGIDTYADMIVSDALDDADYAIYASVGSCYDSTSHAVTCNVAESDCTGSWYAAGYIGSSGCCHCDCEHCDHTAETGTSCTYYGSATSVDLTDTQRDQIITKGVAYINAWIYSLHELYSAISKCEDGLTTDASGAPHYWDEGWAFYAGSLQTEGGTDGYLAYTLAEKRCTDFGTCGAAGNSADSADRPSLVNRNLAWLYADGLAQAQAGSCTDLTATTALIVSQMTIPLVQGTLKYAYKSDPAGGASGTAATDEKSLAEAWAFAAALLGQLNTCSASAAATVYDNLYVGLGAAGAVPDGYAAVQAAIESTYACLGITCSDVGAYSPMSACSDSSANPTAYPYSPYAGYVPASSVTDHANIDIDMQAIDTATGSADWTTATAMYDAGGNSAKGTGFRTLAGFSKELAGETEWQSGATYWGTNTYADVIVRDALDDADYAVGPATVASPTSVDLTDTQRDQIITKGVAYINAWIYSLHELYSAIGKCQDGNIAAASGAPHAWDEGWVFYAGSLQSEGDTNGYLAYTLAEKRCTDFGTCGAAGTSSDSADRPSLVNRNLLTLYNTGLAQSIAGSCTDLTATKNEIVQQMTIPLVQGTIKYAYKSDPAGGASGTAATDEKSLAEAWAFAAALLGQLNTCDATVAATVYDNLYVGLGTAGAVPDGYAAVKTAIESTYTCLGISCADVGAYSVMSACDDGSTASVITSAPTKAPSATVAPTGCSPQPSMMPTLSVADGGGDIYRLRRLANKCTVVSAAGRTVMSVVSVIAIGATSLKFFF